MLDDQSDTVTTHTDRASAVRVSFGPVTPVASKIVSLLIVEDDELVREMLCSFVERVSGVHVVGAAANGREALLMVEDLRPRVVLTDIVMPFVDGIALTRKVRRRYPDVRVLVLTGYPDEFYLTGALNAGATGYLLKGSSPDELDIALRAVGRGEAYVTPSMATCLLPKRPGPIDTTKPSQPRLTPRQGQVLRLIAAGKTNKEVAAFLDVTVKTVEKHRSQLMRRFGVRNAVDLVRSAMQKDLVPVRKPIKEFTTIR
jgi:DNA-binding NarL/FixJ family response regulator